MFVLVATRRNCDVGENITHNLRTIESIPLTLTRPADITVTGEAWLSKGEFARINTERAQQSEPLFANPRNAAAGSLRQLDPQVTASRRLSCFAYDIEQFGPKTDATSLPTTQMAELDLLHELGFTVNNTHAHAKTVDDVERYYKTWHAKREHEEYEMDGIVIKVNELDVQRQSVAELIEQLGTIQRSDTAVPTVKLYEGTDGFKRMLEETLTAKGEVLVFTYVTLFSRLVGVPYLENYFQRRAAKGINTRLIFPPSTFADRVNKRAVDYRIRIRLLPADMKWSAGIFCWNSCIALMSYTENKLTTTVVENQDIAHFYRNVVFELAWRQGKPI